MKFIYTLILFAVMHAANAQNYQCLQTGVARYFINGYGYLHGMHIDSTATSGDTAIFYPYRTTRLAYDTMGITTYPIDHFGGSWLGKRVRQLTDGTFLFDGNWGDSVTIKTQATVGDNWIFYSDTSHLYYKATITGMDTITISGDFDSLKKILITANDDSGIVTTDPVDSFEIILSKNHGFVRVFDLYTFPYHLPGQPFRSGLDFILDMSSKPGGFNTPRGLTPSRINKLFDLVDFINPSETELYDWNAGDIIEGNHQDGLSPLAMENYRMIPDTVVSRITSGTTTTITLSGLHYSCTCMCACSLISNAGTMVLSDNIHPICPSGYIPESFGYDRYIQYNPNDTNFCRKRPTYTVTPSAYNAPGSFDFSYETTRYKLGIGKIHFDHFDDENGAESDDISYYSIAGVSCGTPLPSFVGNAIAPLVRIYPNPASSMLTINCGQMEPLQITVTNIIGTVVKSLCSPANLVNISVADYAPGQYIISIITKDGDCVNRQVTIAR